MFELYPLHFVEFLLQLLAFCAITAFASVAHGGGYWKKPFVVLFHLFAIYSFCGIIFTPFALLWWGMFRRGWQAKAELNYITNKGGLYPIFEAYVWPVGYGAVEIAKKWKERREQEFLLGAYTSVFLVVVPMILETVLDVNHKNLFSLY